MNSTIVEDDSEEECESDLYKQYSHLVYHEVDAIDGSSSQADTTNSSEHVNKS